MKKKELLKKLHYADMVAIHAKAELAAWKQSQPERDKELLELRNNVKFWREQSHYWEGMCREHYWDAKQEKSIISKKGKA